MAADTLSRIVEHLQFLGYEINHGSELITAKHAKKMNIALRTYKGGVLFTAINSTKDAAKRDRLGFLNYLNYLNSQATVARFYADKDSDLFIEAWYPDEYDRTKFGTFIENWETDSWTTLIGNGDLVMKFLN